MEEWTSDLGYHQKSSWRHLDRLHEEVVEIESPFAATFASGTLVFTFMLTGDQNAGKSTFLHAFTDDESRNYIELLSILPILSSSFVNSRFLAPDDPTPPRDEGRFLDTDLGHANIVVTADDFAFFVAEYGLDPRLIRNAPRDTIYFALKFIEFGGDHLDRLMTHESSGHPSIDTIVEKSRETLKTSQQIIYFVNAQHLLEDEGVIDRLVSRLDYLNSELPANTKVLVLCTRHAILDNPEALAQLKRVLLRRLVAHGVPVSTALNDSNAETLLNDALLFLAHQKHWSLQLQQVFLTNHLNDDGTTNPSAVVLSLSRFFKHDMIQGAAAPLATVARHLIDCFNDHQRRMDMAETSFSLWISKEDFQDYLDEADTIIPTVTCLALFERVVELLSRKFLALKLGNNNLADLRIALKIQSKMFVSPNTADLGNHDAEANVTSQGESLTLVRFAYHQKLFNSCFSYLHRHIPDQLWLREDENGESDTRKAPEDQEEQEKQEEQEEKATTTVSSQAQGPASSIFRPERDQDVLEEIAMAAADLRVQAQLLWNKLEKDPSQLSPSCNKNDANEEEAEEAEEEEEEEEEEEAETQVLSPILAQLMCTLEEYAQAIHLLSSSSNQLHLTTTSIQGCEPILQAFLAHLGFRLVDVETNPDCMASLDNMDLVVDFAVSSP